MELVSVNFGVSILAYNVRLRCEISKSPDLTGVLLARGFGDATVLDDNASHKSDPFDHFRVR